MSITISLISKTHIEPNILAAAVTRVSEKLHFYSVFDAGIYIDSIRVVHGGCYIRVYLYNPVHFNETLHNFLGTDKQPYGVVANIDYESDEPLIVPFLRGIVQEFPQLFLYDEMYSKDGYYLYNKAYFDKHAGDNYDDVLLQPEAFTKYS